ncbi:MAG: hypothetical protein BWY99_01763 [Synergistetes bacterium ADurb.BinA166]|nr:MAG: hypothetical protein BWY99_01763 [Synergistetes bacterium ADurb.BinA166]
MSDPQLAARALQHSRRSGPNSLERRLQELFPSLLFTGDGSFWKFLPRLGRNKNPDFVLPGPHPDSIFRDASVAVEVFGSYWHGEAKTGKSVVEHELETVAAWNDVGFKCLVVWEPEFKDERRMIKRIEEFLARAPSS